MEKYEFKETKFFVGEKEYTDEQLLVLIPREYKPLFSGAHFKDMHHLSMALMFAHVAEEARYYKRAHVLRENENSLRNCFK